MGKRNTEEKEKGLKNKFLFPPLFEEMMSENFFKYDEKHEFTHPRHSTNSKENK